MAFCNSVSVEPDKQNVIYFSETDVLDLSFESTPLEIVSSYLSVDFIHSTPLVMAYEANMILEGRVVADNTFNLVGHFPLARSGLVTT